MKQAMIFAAGLGTRLKPLTDTMPKALVRVGGQPLLWHVIHRLKAVGVERIVVNVHHFADQIIDYLKANDHFGIDIRISDERDMLLETGGGIKKARSLFSPDSPILIHNVDILSNADLAALLSEGQGAGGFSEGLGAGCFSEGQGAGGRVQENTTPPVGTGRALSATTSPQLADYCLNSQTPKLPDSPTPQLPDSPTPQRSTFNVQRSTLLVSPRKSTRHLIFDGGMRLIGWYNETTGEVKSPFSEVREAFSEGQGAGHFSEGQGAGCREQENTTPSVGTGRALSAATSPQPANYCPNSQTPKLPNSHPQKLPDSPTPKLPNSPTFNVQRSTFNVQSFSGIHVFSPTLFPLMDEWPDRFSIIDFYLKVCDRADIRGVADDHLRLLDVGKLDSLAQAEQLLHSIQ